jgi:D-glycero-D-manno-heptose 1,7-bisphosphate phosphatase
MVGDKDIDVQAGHRAGCRSCMVRTGYGAGHDPGAAEHVAESLTQAVDHILAGWPWPRR